MIKKNIFLCLYVFILFSAIVFFTAACASASRQVSAPQTIITITDIPAEYNGRGGLISFNSNHAWAKGVVDNGVIEMPVLDWVNDRPFFINGSFQIVFEISATYAHTDAVNFIYTGIIISKNIIQIDTYISWNEFIQVH